MNKYVYYEGKIYEKITNVYNQTLYCHKNDIHHFFEVKELCEDYVEFDNFEEILEVGDLVECSNSMYKVTDVDMIENEKLYLELNATHYERFEYVDAIYKHINNTYIRICYKEQNEWVID